MHDSRLRIGGVLVDASRTEHDRVGGFDPAFFPAYYEDADFARAGGIDGWLDRGRRRIRVSVHRKGSSTDDTRIPDTTSQRLLLLDRWPDLASTQPSPPGRLMRCQSLVGGATTLTTLVHGAVDPIDDRPEAWSIRWLR